MAAYGNGKVGEESMYDTDGVIEEEEEEDGEMSSYDLIELTNDSNSLPEFGNNSTMDGDIELQDLSDSKTGILTTPNSAGGEAYEINPMYEQHQELHIMKGSDLDDEEEYVDQSDID